MKVKKLRKLLETVPDNADVIIGVNDNEYDGEWVQYARITAAAPITLVGNGPS